MSSAEHKVGIIIEATDTTGPTVNLFEERIRRLGGTTEENIKMMTRQTRTLNYMRRAYMMIHRAGASQHIQLNDPQPDQPPGCHDGR